MDKEKDAQERPGYNATKNTTPQSTMISGLALHTICTGNKEKHKLGSMKKIYHSASKTVDSPQPTEREEILACGW